MSLKIEALQKELDDKETTFKNFNRTIVVILYFIFDLLNLGLFQEDAADVEKKVPLTQDEMFGKLEFGVSKFYGNWSFSSKSFSWQPFSKPSSLFNKT